MISVVEYMAMIGESLSEDECLSMFGAERSALIDGSAPCSEAIIYSYWAYEAKQGE